ncbi:hypothetical protein N7532_003576, partial [Penicillium argentinense]
MAGNSTFPFTIKEHLIDGQHIREYPNATNKPGPTFKIAIKKYTPIVNPNPQPGDVTIIGAMDVGFRRHFNLSCTSLSGDICSSDLVWTAIEFDAFGLQASQTSVPMAFATKGLSQMITTSCLGHSRDLLHMVNTFRDEMPESIVEVSHSMGAAQLHHHGPRPHPGHHVTEATRHLDLAVSSNRNCAKTYKQWNKRGLERWIQNAYRDLPAETENGSKERLITLAGCKHQEVLQYLRPDPSDYKLVGECDADHTSLPTHDPCNYPDIIGPSRATSLLY